MFEALQDAWFMHVVHININIWIWQYCLSLLSSFLKNNSYIKNATSYNKLRKCTCDDKWKLHEYLGT